MINKTIAKGSKWIIGVAVVVLLIAVIVALSRNEVKEEESVSPTAMLGGLVDESLTMARQRANDAVRKSDIKQVATLLDQYKIDNGSYPVSVVMTAFDTGILNEVAALTDSSVIPENGPLGADDDYMYQTNEDGSMYTLSTVLEDGEIFTYPEKSKVEAEIIIY